MNSYIDYAPITEDIDTIGELRQFLKNYDDGMPVRVNDDGRIMRVSPRRRTGRSGDWMEL